MKKIIPLVKTRIANPKEFDGLVNFFFDRPTPKELLQSTDLAYLKKAQEVLSDVEFEKSAIETKLVSVVKENGWTNMDFFTALRLAIAGQRISPPLTESLIILGRQEVLERLKL